MRVFGLTISRSKTAVGPIQPTPYEAQQMQSRGWFSIIREGFTGAWQRNIATPAGALQAHVTVFACLTLIAGDISKMRLLLVKRDEDGISTEVESKAYSPVLEKPNHYQNRMQFLEAWVLSKLQAGNTYVLKERDERKVVVGLYPLDPTRVKAVVAPNGDVYYQLSSDYLSGLGQDVTVPASEIIHDRWNCFFHPLCGIAPLAAAALPAMQGLKIQQQSARFFSQGAQLSGVLTAPGLISTDAAKRIEEHWEQNFTGEGNEGKVAVLGDGLKFEPMVMTSVNAQLIEQLKWTGEAICSAFHVPAYKVGVGPFPLNNNVESLDQQFYSQCLQNPIEAIELCLEEGLRCDPYEIEMDLDGLLRMDSQTKMTVETGLVKGGIATPNEARARFNRKPLNGGSTVYLQEQDHALEWLFLRDQQPPAAPSAPTPPVDPSATKALDTDQTDAAIAAFDEAMAA